MKLLLRAGKHLSRHRANMTYEEDAEFYALRAEFASKESFDCAMEAWAAQWAAGQQGHPSSASDQAAVAVAQWAALHNKEAVATQPGQGQPWNPPQQEAASPQNPFASENCTADVYVRCAPALRVQMTPAGGAAAPMLGPLAHSLHASRSARPTGVAPAPAAAAADSTLTSSGTEEPPLPRGPMALGLAKMRGM